MAGDADAIRVDRLAPEWVVHEEADGEADVAWTLPELVREICNIRIISVGAVMIERGHDVAARSQRLGEPGVIKAVAAASMREHDEGTLRAVECRLHILVKVQLGEEWHDEWRGRAVLDCGGIKHRQRQMAPALARGDVFELSDPDRGAAARALGHGCSG